MEVWILDAPEDRQKLTRNRMKTLRFFLVPIIAITISSCSTYQIPLDSFEEQFKDRDPARLNITSTRSPFGTIATYQTNIIDSISCTDKHNNVRTLKKIPSLELRITEKNNKKTIFYADQVFVRDSIVCGEKSRIINMNKCIPLHNIKKVEIQDGHKAYKYK